MTEWKKRSELLGNEKYILVYSVNGYFHVVHKARPDDWAIYECDGYFTGESIDFEYWMPLPEKPKEEKIN